MTLSGENPKYNTYSRRNLSQCHFVERLRVPSEKRGTGVLLLEEMGC